MSRCQGLYRQGFLNSELTDMEDVKQKIEAWLKEVEKGE
jgi:hypothetical protein